MTDMLVKLFDIVEDMELLSRLSSEGIQIKRALAPDKNIVVKYAKEINNDGYESECEISFTNSPVTCFIAVKDKQLIGFACFEATAKNYFGPTVVNDEYRGKGIGKALLLKSLIAMREYGYAYAIIGWVEEARGFFEKACGAKIIENSAPGIYTRLIEFS